MYCTRMFVTFVLDEKYTWASAGAGPAAGTAVSNTKAHAMRRKQLCDPDIRGASLLAAMCGTAGNPNVRQQSNADAARVRTTNLLLRRSDRKLRFLSMSPGNSGDRVEEFGWPLRLGSRVRSPWPALRPARPTRRRPLGILRVDPAGHCHSDVRRTMPLGLRSFKWRSFFRPQPPDPLAGNNWHDTNLPQRFGIAGGCEVPGTVVPGTAGVLGCVGTAGTAPGVQGSWIATGAVPLAAAADGGAAADADGAGDVVVAGGSVVGACGGTEPGEGGVLGTVIAPGSRLFRAVVLPCAGGLVGEGVAFVAAGTHGTAAGGSGCGITSGIRAGLPLGVGCGGTGAWL